MLEFRVPVLDTKIESKFCKNAVGIDGGIDAPLNDGENTGAIRVGCRDGLIVGAKEGFVNG